ncbi:MAG: hypothetical protein PHH54_05280 [Candidatus Nanoarchaeia archaeon]|nr:hypothetical protein [Candidatus Nanoarchaeia archaeon]MDD5741370.1 hypothetical protein [Candidatus Nanoarchaeia archaeon]
MVTENLGMYEMIFRIIENFSKYIGHISLIPFAGKYIILSFGTLAVFAKKYLIPKRLMFRKNSRKNR